MELSQKHKDCVSGFLFFKFVEDEMYDKQRDVPTASWRVLLIRKTKPEWQKGKYNGVGGKIEEGETPMQAMEREFFEEADLTIKDWTQFATMQTDDCKVHFFKKYIHTIPRWNSKTEEKVHDFFAQELPLFVVPSNEFLIPMALHNEFKFANLFHTNK